MPVTIQNVTPGSPAARKRIRPGETLLRINGHVIEDVLDYRFYLMETDLRVAVTDGKRPGWCISVRGRPRTSACPSRPT